MAVTKPILLDETGQAIVSKLDNIANNIANQNKMLVATAIASTGLADGTKYLLGEISSLDLTSIPVNTDCGILIYFSTPSLGCTLTYSANTNWLGSSAPTVEASKHYVVLIANGVCGIQEYNPQTMA